MSVSESNNVYQLLVIGDSAVGKTGLIKRFALDYFREGYRATFGCDFTDRIVNMDGETINLKIWDTAGQEYHCGIAQLFQPSSHGIVFAYDITNERSFNNIKKWMKEADKYAAEDVNKLLIGTKCDLSATRAVETDAAEKYADKLGIPFLETSAKSNVNVENAFIKLATQIKFRLEHQNQHASTNTSESQRAFRLTAIKLSDSVRNSGGGCGC